MTGFDGKALSWQRTDSAMELALHREPLNEIGSETLGELESFAEALVAAAGQISSLLIHSRLPGGFCAGADLRELHSRSQHLTGEERLRGVRDFLRRIHAVMNAIDTAPCATIAVVHGVCFGGGFELALTCDLIVADQTARFCFPELRLGLIPGFGGIPRLKRDLGNAVVRDLLLTGRSIGAAKAQAAGLVSQVASPGNALRVALATAAQIGKLDRATSARAKAFVKPLPEEDLAREIELFCELFERPVVQRALGDFAGRTDALPYLPV